jgi:uncharacterized protein
MSLKLSHYIVVTEPIDTKGRRILLSTRTSRNIIITQGCLDYLQSGRIEEVPEKTLEKLKEIKAIVPSEEDELLTIVNENKRSIEEESSTLYEVMQPSANCQLGCYYCGQQHTKDQMDVSLINKIEERIRSKAASGKFTHLYIGWFGAEPLMGLRQIRELTTVFKQIAHDFSLGYGAKVVTNGLSLKEAIFDELVGELAVNSIEVTLDGTETYHDQHRHTKESGKSFALIFQNLKNILTKPDFEKLGCQITVRCNVDQNNFEGVTPLMELLKENNLHQKIANFYPIGIYSWGNDAHKKSLTKEEFAQRELVWLAQKIKNNFRVSSLIPNRVKKVCFTVSKHSEMYDSYGNVFDCSEVSYVPVYKGSEFVLGNINNASPTTKFKRSVLNDWNDTILTDKFPCHTCEMLPVCGGCCPKSWHEDMRACPTNKFNIKDKLMMSYVLNQPTKQDLKNKLLEISSLYPKKEWISEIHDLFYLSETTSNA